jgi:MarR family transcriptional regulator for hemolysin
VLEYDFQSSMGHWVCMTAHLYQRAMNEELMPEGITFRQCQVLGWLALEGELSQVELADRMNIEPGTLVRVLDRMERGRLIARMSCPGDRRRKIIRPLRSAETVWKKIILCAERVRARAIRGLTRDELNTLKKLLGRVQTNLGKEKMVREIAS